MQHNFIAILLLGLAPFVACSGKQPTTLGVVDGSFHPCPASPNCVSSDAEDAEHRIEPFALAVPPDAAWSAIQAEVAKLPRTSIAESGPTYLHAKCTSALFRFVDDLELQLRSSQGLVAVRSASRVGRSDLGVNRRRVESLRETLQARGVVR